MKSVQYPVDDKGDMSRPARGAWVEIVSALEKALGFGNVAPRKGRVG